jgi:hypothetical protein
MLGEIDLLGAFVPTIAAWLAMALIIFVIGDSLLTRTDFYKLFWHAPLVRFALFVCLFCTGGLIAGIT